MWDEREKERQRRAAYEERRRKSLTPEQRAYEDLWVELFGDRRNPDNRGTIGRLDDRLERLERRAAWATAAGIGAMLTLVVDLVVRLAKP